MLILQPRLTNNLAIFNSHTVHTNNNAEAPYCVRDKKKWKKIQRRLKSIFQRFANKKSRDSNKTKERFLTLSWTLRSAPFSINALATNQFLLEQAKMRGVLPWESNSLIRFGWLFNSDNTSSTLILGRCNCAFNNNSILGWNDGYFFSLKLTNHFDAIHKSEMGQNNII